MAPRKRRGIRQGLLVQWAASHRIETVGLAGGVVIILLCLFTGLLTRSDVWAGLGQWIGGLGTIAAVVAALCIARSEARRAEVERHRQERDAQLANARLVTAEIELTDEENIDPQLSIQDYPHLRVRITNRGFTHILNPMVDALISTSADAPISWTITDLDGGPLERYHGPPAVLPFGGAEVVPININITSTLPQPGRRPSSAVISYTTADGIRWRRTGTGGEPVRVPERDTFPTEGPDWYRS